MAAGFQPAQPAFFMWLGVVPYLPRQTITMILQFIATLPTSGVVFDYAEPLENYAPELRAGLIEIAARAAAIGEPWLSYFDPTELSANLQAQGFQEMEDLGLADLSARYPGAWTAAASGAAGPHLMHARLVSA